MVRSPCPDAAASRSLEYPSRSSTGPPWSMDEGALLYLCSFPFPAAPAVQPVLSP
jgi:hypothetical protein